MQTFIDFISGRSIDATSNKNKTILALLIVLTYSSAIATWAYTGSWVNGLGTLVLMNIINAVVLNKYMPHL